MQIRPLVEGFSVAPQVGVADVALLAQQGIRSIINDRPEGEAPGQPSSAKLAAAAAAAGVAYRHVPVQGLPPSDATVADFAVALAELPPPVLAFCRSGMRSTTLWAVTAAQAGRPLDDILDRAGAAGYDLTPLAPWLATLVQS